MTMDVQGRVAVTGAGYIKFLHDSDQDERADTASLFAKTQGTGRGLCFQGSHLAWVGTGGLWWFRDADQDGQADGPPESWLKLAGGETGGRAIRQGPDGEWYLTTGYETGLDAGPVSSVNTASNSAEGGLMIRISADRTRSQIVAHGFGNPRDFDFSAFGDCIVAESEVGRNGLLPWSAPARLIHVGPGGYHGWKSDGGVMGHQFPDYYPEMVESLVDLGSGVPSGMVCYRHQQFPERYWGGFFILDESSGRVWFVSMRTNGSTYRAQPELFMDTIAAGSFRPVDVLVTPDGTLLIAAGGREGQSGIYRVEHTGGLSRTRTIDPRPTSVDLESALMARDYVLNIPQPLEAWSRVLWIPVALKAGAEGFLEAARDNRLSGGQRIRAIEVLTELFAGLNASTAMQAIRASLPQVRARVAWSLGRAPCPEAGSVLLLLAQDRHALVRRCVWDAAGDLVPDPAVNLLKLVPPLSANLAHRDKRVRQAAARFMARLPAPAWDPLWKQLGRAGYQAKLSSHLAAIWRGASAGELAEALERTLTVLEMSSDERLRLQAVRLVTLALGEPRGTSRAPGGKSVFSDGSVESVLIGRIEQALSIGFPGEQPEWNREAARLLGFIEAGGETLPMKVASLLTKDSSLESDLHCLSVLGDLQATWEGSVTKSVAEAIRDTISKAGKMSAPDRALWEAYFAQAISRLEQKHPELAALRLR
jgi:glucose/arabinose dehydrogenase